MELLTTGKITFPRPDKEELRAIIGGKYTYDELLEKYGNADEAFAAIENKFVLQKTPNEIEADKLCQELVQRQLRFK
jgi:hypothetical protein